MGQTREYTPCPNFYRFFSINKFFMIFYRFSSFCCLCQILLKLLILSAFMVFGLVCLVSSVSSHSKIETKNAEQLVHTTKLVQSISLNIYGYHQFI
jgi:hypothetical protein